ncbi:SDR family oxidoreductase [Fluviicola sp.]|jgi:3-oxoacyl-[acyl-carrier protein] reductase|uniref:SDR family oxidoreductase n=1 Tax=Fluviicola sp. TaxID=1917219 RepID=UPI00281CB6A7|nr:SDR family oxidoreductase [Fluviicola sp.]MDR0801578.1 SDR family oxidoreductase [Fluviicola sp.]
MDLKGKTALVSGSTQGIGKAVALKLAEMGAKVVLLARNEDKLKSVLDELSTGSGQKHNYLVADFSNPSGLQQAVENYFSNGNLVDILVNNTGGPKAGPVMDADISEFLAAFNQHLICNHILVQAVVPGMKKLGEGRIINIISTSVKQPLPGLGVSNTIRGAVGNWSKTLANELGQFNITVNNVLPGATNTTRLQEIASNKSKKTGEPVDTIFEEMAEESPMKRIARPEEIAAAVVFLASPGASYINGINIPVDGGRTKSL